MIATSPHEISRLPDVEDGKAIKRKVKAYPIGYFHIDIAEVGTAGGKLVERMNRTIKEATVKRFHYDTRTPSCAAISPTSSTHITLQTV